MMEKVNIVRALVTERLTLAAEEIFALVERTIVEYEQELCRCKEENQRKQQLLDSLLITTTPTRENTSQDAEIQTEKQEDSPLAIEEKPSDFTCVDVKNEEQCDEFQPMNLDEEERAENANFIVQPRDNGNKNTNDQMENKSVRSSARKRKPVVTPEFQQERESHKSGQNQRKSKKKKSAPKKRVSSTIPRHRRSRPSQTFTNLTPKHIKSEFYCSQCGKTFRRLHHLERHGLIHTDERPFICSVCSKAFRLKQHLMSHMSTHTDERSFSCSVCEQTFKRKDHLREHAKTHLGIRRFGCSECDMRFSLKKNLLRHKIVHSRDATFTCSVCHKTFSSLFYFQKHNKTHKRKKGLH